MSISGEGNFDSDQAMDFIAHLRDCDDFEPVREVLCLVANTNRPAHDIDAFKLDVMAAAGIVAAAGGLPPSDLPEEVAVWLAQHDVSLTAELLDCALRAVERVRLHWEREREYHAEPARVEKDFWDMRDYWAFHGYAFEESPQGVRDSFAARLQAIDNVHERLRTLAKQIGVTRM